MKSAIIVGLQEISKIFQLIYYRNKNQHRHASWWKYFSILKRNIYKLAQDLLVVDGARREEETANIPHSRIGFMRNILLPKCYLPFTQLIRDSQFSAIGLVLLAELAKIRRMLEKISAEYNNKNNNDDKKSSGSVGETIIKGSPADDNNHSTRKSYRMEQSSLQEEQDVGERIPRELASKAEAGSEGAAAAVIGSSRSSKKTRRVHVNEIDQLFDGLA